MKNEECKYHCLEFDSEGLQFEDVLLLYNTKSHNLVYVSPLSFFFSLLFTFYSHFFELDIKSENEDDILFTQTAARAFAM
jgi:hypothetical protein